MQRRTFQRALLSLTVGVAMPKAFAASEATEAMTLLTAADNVRNPEGSFSVLVSLVEYRGGVQIATSAMTVYSKPAPDSGQYNNLVKFVSPARDAGKLLLRNGIDLWFYDPANRASVRISPKARLLGQASNGDVLATNLARDYSAEIVARESVADDTKTMRACVKLKLVGERADVPYSAVDYWVEESSKRPIKAQFRTAEGRLMKTAFFRRYQTELGRERPTETVIIDGLDPQWITVMRSSDYKTREIPQTWLQREYLARFTGETE